MGQMSTRVEEMTKSKRRFSIRSTVFVVGMLALSSFAIVGVTVERRSNTDPQLCTACHNMQPYADSYLNSNHLDNVHRQANVGCQDCHTDYTLGDEINSAWRYVQGAYQTPMQRRTFDQAMCNRCHISMAYQAARTDFLVRNPHLSHWPDLVCSDCHVVHAEQINYCGLCHDNGGQRLTGEPIVPRADNPWARVTPAPQTP